MLGDVPGLSAAMQAALSSEEYRVRQLIPGSQAASRGSNRFEVDLSSSDSLAEVHTLLGGAENRKSRVGAVINLLGLGDSFQQPGGGSEDALRLGQWLFGVLKEFGRDLKTSAKHGGGWLFNITALDGKFGLHSAADMPLAQAVTIGMCKTVQREWLDVAVKNIDVERGGDLQLLFPMLAEELQSLDGSVEVGLCENRRWVPKLVPAPIADRSANRIALSEDSVLLCTGGAYGITVDALLELARSVRPRVILVGRSELEEEPAETAALPDESSLRAHFIRLLRAESASVTPAEIERVVQRVLKARQIRRNLLAMERAGLRVEYHSLDVCDAGAFGALIDELYSRYGRIDGAIHAAGIIEDAPIARKSVQSFRRVLSTKVIAASTLAEKLRPDSLKFLAFFSSVSGRFGNAGQVDYAAGNEFLNKLALQLDAQWPARVVAINWGPWEGGMVSDELRRMYGRYGIQLLDRHQGAAAFVDELSIAPGSAEVLVSHSVDAIATLHREPVLV